jgi:hypothetical protein
MMASQKYTGMKIAATVVTGAVNGDTINYLATTATQFSIWDYPIAVTLGDNP